jgi:uncharacterized protein (TIGR02246 family)
VLLAAFLVVGAEVVAQRKKADAAPANALSKEDDEAIQKTVRGIEDAWNAHDMKAYGKLFREDAEFINVVGMHWRGRDAIIVAHTAFHETLFKNHTIKTDDVEVRSLGSGHAIAVVTTTNDAFTTPAGEVIPKRQNRQTYVLVKDPDGWTIAHAHNVPVDAAAAKHDPTKTPMK